ncbi:MAG: proline--tRNA ligase [Deltaproteobacteria bacterium]|nr:proline--tRNA ligase [Deltaproteobacteria bacterium]
MKEKVITSRSEDYSEWYLDVIREAELAENGPARGTIIIKPNGYAIWEAVQNELNQRFKELGVRNVYFPLLIPEKLISMEKEHIEGFAPEVAVVTYAGGKELEEKLILRPTSETIMYETFSRWIQSYRDLPLLINQWANVVRWELRPRLFLRGTEFLWQEGHTAHSTETEADEFSRKILQLYKNFFETFLAIPVISGVKPDLEKFAGALRTYTLEAMMQDGKALQVATSHNLGQNFSKAFNIKFLDQNQQANFVWQTSWGVSTRVIGALVMTHSDDNGLILPPSVAPTAVIVTLVGEITSALIRFGQEVLLTLKNNGFTAEVDDRPIRPGNKFYEWERKGVPLRLEIGQTELKSSKLVASRRDNFEKFTFSVSNLVDTVRNTLNEIQKNLFRIAQERLERNIIEVETWNQFLDAINSNKFVKAFIDPSREILTKIKEETLATLRCIPLTEQNEEGFCVKSNKSAKVKGIFAKAY